MRCDDAARARQSRLQADMMRALTGLGSGDLPTDLDPTERSAAAEALAAKRRRGVARSWPALTSALGARFASTFADFAGTTPMPSLGGPLADGRGFAEHLRLRSQLPEPGRLEKLAVDLRFLETPHGLSRRRFPSFVLGWLPDSSRLVIGFRSPKHGEWWRIIRLWDIKNVNTY